MPYQTLLIVLILLSSLLCLGQSLPKGDAFAYTMESDRPDQNFEFAKFKKLVEQLDNPFGLDNTGSNLFTSVVEGWSYASSPQADASEEEYYLAAKFLVGLGIPVDHINIRGISALYYVFRWGADNKFKKLLVDLILAQNPRLSGSYSNNGGLVYILSSSARYLDELRRFRDAGLDLLRRDDSLRNIAHYAARTPSQKGVHLEQVLSLIDSKHHFDLVCEASIDGTTPLHFAVMNDNFEAVQFLLTKFPNLDLNSKSGTLKTPLDLAIELKNKRIIQLLSQADLLQKKF